MKSILDRHFHVEAGQVFRTAGTVRREDGTLGNLFCCPETGNEIAIYTDGWRSLDQPTRWLVPKDVVC